MTQVSRYGHMLKVTVNGMRMRVRARYRVTGSVARPARVSRVVRNAERGCFVMQALLEPVPVTGQTVLNGQPLATD